MSHPFPILMRRSEVIDMAEAVRRTGRSSKTITKYCRDHGIGRQIGSGVPIEISAPALEMVMHGLCRIRRARLSLMWLSALATAGASIAPYLTAPGIASSSATERQFLADFPSRSIRRHSRTIPAVKLGTQIIPYVNS